MNANTQTELYTYSLFAVFTNYTPTAYMQFQQAQN